MRNSRLAAALAAAGGIALGSTAALADNGHSMHGQYFGQLQVTAVTPTPSTGQCGVTAGETLSGIADIRGNEGGGDGQGNGDHHGGNGHGPDQGVTLRFSQNDASSFAVWEEIFPAVHKGNPTPSGSYSFGAEGGTLSTGTFSSTWTVLDRHALLVTNQLTYTSPVDGTTMCSETDQITLIKIVSAGS
ncbi:MAG TPA: hypothetical protein VKS60_21800 [Stellaceae bacterium]|nr:hypothetical protein [Stellaceae bacterium]